MDRILSQSCGAMGVEATRSTNEQSMAGMVRVLVNFLQSESRVDNTLIR